MDGINSCASRFLFYFYGAGLGVNVLHEQENPPTPPPTYATVCRTGEERGEEKKK